MKTRDGYKIVRYGDTTYPTSPQENYVAVYEPPLRNDGKPKKPKHYGDGRVAKIHFQTVIYLKEYRR